MHIDEREARRQVGTALREHADKVTDHWVQLQLEQAVPGSGITEGELREEADALVDQLRAGLETDLTADRVVTEHPGLRQAVTELSLRRARAGATPTATALAVLALKEALLEVVRYGAPGAAEYGVPESAEYAAPEVVRCAVPDTVQDAVPDTVPDAVRDAVLDAALSVTPDAAPDGVPPTVLDAVPDTVPPAVLDAAPPTVLDAAPPTALETVGPTALETTVPAVPDTIRHALPDTALDPSGPTALDPAGFTTLDTAGPTALQTAPDAVPTTVPDAVPYAERKTLRPTPPDAVSLYSAALLINRLLDAAGALSFDTYVEGRDEIIRRQSRQLLEVSTPVVRLWDRVLAVPLVGTLDTTRTQVVMGNLLGAIQTEEAQVAIIDITGVPTVDTAVAHHLMQTVNAVRLMGADCLISGIRPPIAQLMAQLGIDLHAILTRATLADALQTAIELTGMPARGVPAAGR